MAAVRDRVPRDVQHCGVLLLFVYPTDYTGQIFVWEASIFPASQESPAFCASREFSTVFTKPRQPLVHDMSRTNPIHTVPSMYALFSYTVYVPCPSNPCFDKQYKSCSTSLYSVPQSHDTVFLLGPDSSWPPCAGTPPDCVLPFT